jgi:hypothetical protein
MSNEVVQEQQQLLRQQLPHARLDVLEAGHCVWEERAPEFESIVTQWVSGGFRASYSVESSRCPSQRPRGIAPDSSSRFAETYPASKRAS